jgi:threonine/homoserine/homoserine lactone efflux protein
MDHAIFENIFKIAAIHFAVIMVPGQNFLLIVMKTLSESKRNGVFIALGITLGTAIHILLSIFGLSSFILKLPTIFKTLKLLGGTFIVYLGVTNLLKKKLIKPVKHFSPSAINDSIPSSYSSVMCGLLANVFSVRAALYLLTLFTNIASTNKSLPLIGIYAFEVTLITFIWFALVAIVFSSSPWIREVFIQNYKLIMNSCSFILIGIGLFIFSF